MLSELQMMNTIEYRVDCQVCMRYLFVVLSSEVFVSFSCRVSFLKEHFYMLPLISYFSALIIKTKLFPA